MYEEQQETQRTRWIGSVSLVQFQIITGNEQSNEIWHDFGTHDVVFPFLDLYSHTQLVSLPTLPLKKFWRDILIFFSGTPLSRMSQHDGAANQLHIWWTRNNIVSPHLSVNNAHSHRFVSAHAISSNHWPITRGNERVMSSLNYKHTLCSEVHVWVSFQEFLFSLWHLNILTSIIDGDLHAQRPPE